MSTLYLQIKDVNVNTPTCMLLSLEEKFVMSISYFNLTVQEMLNVFEKASHFFRPLNCPTTVIH